MMEPNIRWAVEKGAITQEKIRDFQETVCLGNELNCPRPGRKGEDEGDRIERLNVTGMYPHVVMMGRIRKGRMQTVTSMTWAEVVRYNRKESRMRRQIVEAKKKLKKQVDKPRKTRKPGMTPEEIAQLIRYRERGMSYLDIAIKLGVAVSTARRAYLKTVGGDYASRKR